MLSFHAQLKVFVAVAPCDLRLNFNGLTLSASVVVEWRRRWKLRSSAATTETQRDPATSTEQRYCQEEQGRTVSWCRS